MAAISCHEGAFLPPEAPSGMHQGDILPGIRSPPLVCLECASRVLHSKGAPSSVRNEPRKRFIQECGPSPVRECASKMLRLGPFGCTGERCPALSTPVCLLRCRGALGDAVLRSFGCWMSPLMRWRRSGRSMSGCRYRCRCGRGCRCCPGAAGFWQATPIIACCMALTCC